MKVIVYTRVASYFAAHIESQYAYERAEDAASALIVSVTEEFGVGPLAADEQREILLDAHTTSGCVVEGVGAGSDTYHFLRELEVEPVGVNAP